MLKMPIIRGLGRRRYSRKNRRRQTPVDDQNILPVQRLISIPALHVDFLQQIPAVRNVLIWKLDFKRP